VQNTRKLKLPGMRGKQKLEYYCYTCGLIELEPVFFVKLKLVSITVLYIYGVFYFSWYKDETLSSHLGFHSCSFSSHTSFVPSP